MSMKKQSSKGDKKDIKDIEWTSSKPMPNIAQHIWKESTEDIMRYIDWHARHPGCVTPREFTKKYADGTPILADTQMIDDDDPNKFYYTYSSVMKNGMSPMHHEQYDPPKLGKDGDIASVAEVTSQFEREQFQVMKRDYDDPWYVASVRDQLNSGYHADGYRTPSGNLSCPITYKEMELKAQLTRARKHVVIKATPSDFETAAVENKEQFAKFSVETSGINAKSEELQRKSLNKLSVWGSPQIWSRHTKDGTALSKWKRKVLLDDIKNGLEEYEATIVKLKKEKKKEKEKKKLISLPLISLWKSSPKIEDSSVGEKGSKEIDNNANIIDNVNDNSSMISDLTLQDFDESNNLDLYQNNIQEEPSPLRSPRVTELINFSSKNSPSTISIDSISKSGTPYDSPSKKDAPYDSPSKKDTPCDSPSKKGTPYDSPSRKGTPGSTYDSPTVKSTKRSETPSALVSQKDDVEFSSDEEGKNEKNLSYDEALVEKFNEQMGGLDKVDKLADEWVSYATVIRKKAKKSSTLFDMNMDIADACDRGSYARALAILTFGANPNTELDDIPIFNHIFQKCVNFDIQFDELNVGSPNTSDREKYQKILDLLVMFKAKVNSTKSKEGFAPIHIAANAGDAKLVNWILKNGGEVDCYDKEGLTALMIAARNGHIYVIAELLRGYAEINKREKDQHEPGNFKKIISKGRTALHFAASTGQTRACIFLIGCQADKKIVDYDGNSPALTASEASCEATAQQILTYARPVLTFDYQLNTMMTLKKQEEDEANSILGQMSSTADQLGNLLGTASILGSSGVGKISGMFGNILAGRKKISGKTAWENKGNGNDDSDVVPFDDT